MFHRLVSVEIPNERARNHDFLTAFVWYEYDTDLEVDLDGNDLFLLQYYRDDDVVEWSP